MNYTKVFVLEKGKYLFLRDNTGREIGFESQEEILKYTGFDLSGKVYIGYEPDINFFVDSEDPAIDPDMIPYTPYEDMISSIQTFISRKEDPFYGLDLDDARQMARDLISAESERLQLENFVYDGHNYYADREKLHQVYTVASNAAISGQPFSVVWTTADKDASGKNIRITHDVNSFRLLAMTLFERNQIIYQKGVDKKEEVMDIGSIALVKAYNFTDFS